MPPPVSLNRFRYRVRAISRVKSRFPSEICRLAAQSGLEPSNRPQIIEAGLWGRQGLHQSLQDKMDMGSAPSVPSGRLPHEMGKRQVLTAVARRFHARGEAGREAGEGVSYPFSPFGLSF